MVVSEKLELEEDLKEIKKQNFLLQEKNKEADERINDLSDELDLEKGLREEMRLESASIAEQLKALQEEKETFAKEIEDKKGLREKLAKNLEDSQGKVKKLKSQLEEALDRGMKLNELYQQKEQETLELKESVKEREGSDRQGASDKPISKKSFNSGIELEEIVVVPSSKDQNRRF